VGVLFYFVVLAKTKQNKTTKTKKNQGLAYPRQVLYH
jgi:hypothetical protein